MMWAVLPWYAAGAALSVLVFVSLAVVPDPALVLILALGALCVAKGVRELLLAG